MIKSGTPILGGVRSKERFLALERRKNTIIAVGDSFDPSNYRGSGAMQTLGAKNEFVRNVRHRSTLDTKRPSKGPAPTPPQNTNSQFGVHNSSYKNDSDEEISLHGGMNDGNSGRNVMNLNMFSGGSNMNTRRSRDQNNSEV